MGYKCNNEYIIYLYIISFSKFNNFILYIPWRILLYENIIKIFNYVISL